MWAPPLLGKGQPVTAVEMLQKSIASGPPRPDALKVLGDALAQLRRKARSYPSAFMVTLI